jgi:hypothetical protein
MNDKMKTADEDYLWDQTGEPDAEIQELERVLGSHRYEPRPMAIPEMPQFETSPRRNFQPLLAIAATIILAVGAFALWRGFASQEAPEMAKGDAQPAAGASNSDRAAATIPIDVQEELPNAGGTETSGGQPATVDEDLATSAAPGNRIVAPRRNRSNQSGVKPNRTRFTEPPAPVLAANELKEAEEGKAKLMLALRVASSKFNFAIRKVQGINNGNQIHNQHKIG